jgi:hypothetical protein
MFWDGTRWIDERAPAAAPPPSRRRARDWLATGVMILGIVALAIPFVATSAASSSADRLIASWSDSHQTRVFQESTVLATYVGTWNRQQGDQFMGSYAAVSTQADAAVDFSFTGSGVSWIGPKGPNQGKARVYLDGRYVRTVDTYSRNPRPRESLFTALFSDVTDHTLSIHVLASTAGRVVTVDAFAVRDPLMLSAAAAAGPAPTSAPVTAAGTATSAPVTAASPAPTATSAPVTAASPAPTATSAPVTAANPAPTATSAPVTAANPAPTPSSMATGMPTATPTATPVPTVVPTAAPTATPRPTSTPVPTPTPTSTLTPTPTPTPTPSASCGTSLQSLINAAPSGSVLTVPACVYRESVTVSKPLTINGYGAVIDGRDVSGAVVRNTWMLIDADGVTVAGFTMRYANDNPLAHWGALRIIDGRNRTIIRDCDLSYATYADIAIGTANSALVTNCAIHHGGALGIHAGGDGTNGQNNSVTNSHIYNNNTGGFDPEWESGGLKATRQTNLLLDGNEVNNNIGPGLWCDIYCRNTTYSNNRVHDNSYAGIMEEVSYGAKIIGNVVWRNGAGKADWGWGAGILVSSSTGTEVANNTLAWNARSGVSIISQNRSDWPAVVPPVNISVHDNQTFAIDNTWLMFWAQDWAGPLFAASSNSHGANNSYYMSYAEDGRWRFSWSTNQSYLAAFNATAGEEGGTYLTTAQKNSILSALGVATTP